MTRTYGTAQPHCDDSSETEILVTESQWQKSFASIVATALTVFAIILVLSGVMEHGTDGIASPSEGSLNTLQVPIEDHAETDFKMTSSNEGNVSTPEASRKPHIFFILVDDQGHNDIGYNSLDLDWATPFIDNLAKGGMILERYYALHLCTPSRAALMTGHYPYRIGMQHGVIQAAAPWGLPLKTRIMPQYLNTLGYESHMIGKWHLGFHNESFIPTSRGFDTYLGYLGDQEHYKTHKYDRTVNNKYFYDFIETKNSDNSFRLLAKEEEFANTSSAVAFVKRTHYLLDTYEAKQGKRPLFLYLAFQNVHGPLDVIEDDYFHGTGFLKYIQEVPDLQRRKFSRLTAQLDQSVEAVYNRVRDTVGLENSVFIYASDNGGCKDAGGYNTPLRGGKHYLYEGGMRVPSWIHGPMIPKNVVGTKYNGLFHVSDWLPTIVQLVGDVSNTDVSDILNWEAIDGISQWKAMKRNDGTAYPRTELVLSVDRWATVHGDLEPLNYTRGAMIKGDWKILVNEYHTAWYTPLTSEEWNSYGIEEQEEYGQSVGDCTTDFESPMHSRLFNITADPNEETDLWKVYPEVAAELESYMNNVEVIRPGWQRVMEARAAGVWEKNSWHMVPWCDCDCIDLAGLGEPGQLHPSSMPTSQPRL